ncbi:MAG: Nramp family divalent metal transporter [Phycisphaerae bacterium]|nr:Nramp family divalent metal transporter [Phycisphaerae bacterium]
MSEVLQYAKREDAISAGHGQAWQVGELPSPPAKSLGSYFRLAGPGAIILSLSIGSGEWLLGPKTAVEHGTSLLWICTIAVILQTVFNIECIRYTLYCGEPIMVGFTRLAPGPRFWRVIWLVLLFLSVGPGWALASATAMAAMILRRLPQDGNPSDRLMVMACGFVAMLLVLLLLSIGKSVQRSIERFSWIGCAFIFSGLLFLVIRFVPWSTWASTATGFVEFGQMPTGVSPVLLAAFAAYSAAGGIFNTATSNWSRDKGYGMGQVVGYIPALIGGDKVTVGASGTVFRVNDASLPRWKTWLWYVRAYQWTLFGLGAMLGMYFCVLLAVGLIPAGTNLAGWSIAAYQGEAVGREIGPTGWLLVLGTGAWVLFTTQVNCSDACVRQSTELLWQTSPVVRSWCRGDIRRLYYGILAAFVLWTGALFTVGTPLSLVILSANVAGVVFVVAGIQVLLVNHRLLPRALRPSVLTRCLIAVMVIFYGIFAAASIWDKITASQARPTTAPVTAPATAPPTSGPASAPIATPAAGAAELCPGLPDLCPFNGQESVTGEVTPGRQHLTPKNAPTDMRQRSLTLDPSTNSRRFSSVPESSAWAVSVSKQHLVFEPMYRTFRS